MNQYNQENFNRARIAKTSRLYFAEGLLLFLAVVMAGIGAVGFLVEIFRWYANFSS